MVQKSPTLLIAVLAAMSYTAQAVTQKSASHAPEPVPAPTNTQTQTETLSSVIDMNGIRADFNFAPVSSGPGAQVTVEVQKGLSKAFAVSPTGGFEYHIHAKPVGPNNDCMATGGHLDPTNVGAAKCNPAKAAKCQEGDLSGKHGEIKASESGQISKISYIDHQVQFSGETTTIAGRSVVIHNNGTRVACGDILPIGAPRNNTINSNGNSNSTASSDENTGANHPSSGNVISWNSASLATCVLMGVLSGAAFIL
ncbi:hypothetical protein BGZ76_006641 [Entomortierella beljakovae]|nr:hypothetical protein BGZ76_006641 [Entomortierella beljakovae]